MRSRQRQHKPMPHLEKWKQPPIAKVYEALSAVADSRVEIQSEDTATDRSSDGSKTYTVRWSKNRKVFSSTDNASKFGHYIGYPIIAVLIELGDLPIDRTLAHHLAGIRWKQLNDRFKRNYDEAVEHVLSHLEGVDVGNIRQMVGKIHAALKSLALIRQGKAVR